MPTLNSLLIGIGSTLAFGIALCIIWLLANAHLRMELGSTKSDATACRLANGAFKAEVDKQNAAISSLVTETKEHAIRAAAAQHTADAMAARYRKAADELMRRKASDDSCKASDALFSDYLRKNKP